MGDFQIQPWIPPTQLILPKSAQVPNCYTTPEVFEPQQDSPQHRPGSVDYISIPKTSGDTLGPVRGGPQLHHGHDPTTTIQTSNPLGRSQTVHPIES